MNQKLKIVKIIIKKSHVSFLYLFFFGFIFCFHMLIYIYPCHAEKIKMPCPLLIFSQSDYLIQVVDTNSHTLYLTMTNSADPDLLASLEANGSGCTLFAKAGHILVQQGQD